MPLIQTPAVVLGSRNLGEADKLVTFFTPRHGKLIGAAKGCRRVRSRFGAALEPFTHCHLVLFQKTRDTLLRIQQAGIIASFQELREDLDRITWASRLVSRLSASVPEGEANADLFNLLLATLEQLRAGDGELGVCLFEARLLRHLGYQPRLESGQCLRCCAVLGDSPRFLSSVAGGIVCRGCSLRGGEDCLPVGQGALALLRQALRMPSEFIFRLRAAPALRAELKALLGEYLDQILERPQRTK